MAWDWAPAIISSTVVTALTAYCGIFLKAAIERSVQHGFDRQIENLKSDLRAKEDDIKSLRQTALSNLAARNEELDRRRIKAAEALWAATMYQSRFALLVGFISQLDVVEIDKNLKKSESARAKVMEFTEAIWRMSGVQKMLDEKAPLIHNERLFLPLKAWAAYEALSSISGGAIATIGALKTGAGLDLLRGPEAVNKLILSVLPHQGPTIEKYPDTANYYMLKELQELIFVELTASLTSSDAYVQAVEQASKILVEATGKVAVPLPPDVPDEMRAKPIDAAGFP